MSERFDNLSSELIQSVADLKDREVLELVQQRLLQGDDPINIVEDCRQGMIVVGQRYEQQEYFLSGLILAGEILREVMAVVQPLTEKKFFGKTRGLILLGTVEGDIHDAGKDLLQIVLKVNGFDVYDLGVDVPPSEFVAKAKELKPIVIGLSCLIIGAYKAMKTTIAMLRADPETASIPIIIGGQVNSDVCNYVSADHWSTDAVDGMNWCINWVQKVPTLSSAGV